MTDLLARAVRRLASLPESEQDRQAAALLDALDAAGATEAGGDGAVNRARALRDDPAVGMWRDRDDLADAARYVSALRDTDWGRPE